MAIAFALDNSTLPQGGDVTEREQFYVGTLTFSGNYTTGGDPLSFAVSGVQSNNAPIRVEVYEEPTTGETATAYTFIYAKGTTLANGALQIFSAQGTQFAAGAYGTTFATTTVKARVWLPLGR